MNRILSVRGSFLLLLILTSTLIVPLGFYPARADDQSNDTGTNNANQTGAESHGPGQSNATGSYGIGLEVSSFVHNATAIFQQQRNETLQAIKDCRQQMQNASSENRTQIADQCHSTMTAIREKYQALRDQFQQLFRQFRENMMILRQDAEGMHVSDQDRERAMKNIDDDAARNGVTGLNMAFEKMKGVGEKGMMGIEHALKRENETGQYNETGQNRENYNETSDQYAMPTQHGGESRGPPMGHDDGGLRDKH